MQRASALASWLLRRALPLPPPPAAALEVSSGGLAKALDGLQHPGPRTGGALGPAQRDHAPCANLPLVAELRAVQKPSPPRDSGRNCALQAQGTAGKGDRSVCGVPLMPSGIACGATSAAGWGKRAGGLGAQ